MVRDNISKYLGYYHNYLEINCITIINDFYKKELNIDDIEKIIPSDIKNRNWMKKISLEQIDEWALTYGKKVSLTEARDFDVMVFKSERFQRPIHFGMFLKPCHMLHLEEGRTSRYETITNEWATCFHAIYRHQSLV